MHAASPEGANTAMDAAKAALLRAALLDAAAYTPIIIFVP